MTHKQKIEALVGLLLGMFVAFLSSTIVSNALPTIITELHGTQDQYTWVVTATLLASTATTPIWGKFSDLVSKKLLVQLSITLFTIGSILAGMSQSVGMLIGFRAVQGLGLGGLQALVIIVIAAMFSPRERGRYQGPIAAVMSVATVAGPLIGGLIVDTSWLGWRWTFFVGVPLAVIALIVVQRTLNLPIVKKDVSIDYVGATLIAAGVSTLLIWVTLAGKNFEWASAMSFFLVGLGVVLLAAALWVESKVKEPIIPLRLFRDRTTTLATLASIAVGVAMSAGFFLLSTIDHATPMFWVGLFLFVLGAGMGMVMQNLVLAVQNTVAPSDLGTASSTVSFFRSLGGAAGVSVLGAVLSTHVADLTTKGLSAIGVDLSASGGSGAGLSNLNELPEAIQDVVRAAYGDATARVFLIAGILALLSLIAIAFIREKALRTESGDEQLLAKIAVPGEIDSDAVDAELALLTEGDDEFQRRK
jgi:MFS family permease